MSDDSLRLTLVDGRQVSAPLAWFPRLASATVADRSNWRFIGGGVGIHWPALDEDISVESLLIAIPHHRARSDGAAIGLRRYQRRALVKGAFDRRESTNDSHGYRHNNSRGRFTDVSKQAGIEGPHNYSGFTVLTGDFDNDGWPDFYVTCDSTPSLLFRNKHGGTFLRRSAWRPE